MTDRGAGTGRVVALSFDDGPGDQTEAILDLLRGHGVRATFFLVGKAIERRRELVHRLVAEGHELGNHTFSHRKLGGLTSAESERELRLTSELIERETGVRPTLFRPPYGLDGLDARSAAAALGMTTIRWSANSRDWDGSDPQTIAARVIASSQQSSVIVLHDGGGNRESTVRALEIALPVLRAAGLELVTVSEALARSRRERRLVVVRPRGPLRRLVGFARAHLEGRWLIASVA